MWVVHLIHVDRRGFPYQGPFSQPFLPVRLLSAHQPRSCVLEGFGFQGFRVLGYVAVKCAVVQGMFALMGIDK